MFGCVWVGLVLGKWVWLLLADGLLEGGKI